MELIEYHTREQKLEAMERFKDFKPTGGLNIPEHACQYIIKITCDGVKNNSLV